MTAPPLGEATVLFVRIEEIDGLWHALGDTLPQALHDYEVQVRTELSRFGGHETKREDTTYVYVFQDPADAIRATLALRTAMSPRNIAARGVPTPAPLNIGLGLHIGPLVPRTDPHTGRMDYLGTTMNVAARLAMATQGGQTLLTRQLLQAAEECGFPVDDPGREDAWIGYRGVHHFRGMNAQVELLELRPRALAGGALRPLRTTQVVDQPPTTARIPALAAPLFGREDALTTAAAALQSGERTVLLLGPGGVGKSRIAAEFALWCEAGLGELMFPDGVWWVSLAGMSEPYQVVGAVLRAIGLPQLDQDPNGHLARALAARSAMLLVLDEADHAAEILPLILQRWRDRAGELRVLITSRSAPPQLRARTLRLGPLSIPSPDANERSLRRNPSVLLLLNRLRARFGRVVRRHDTALLSCLVALAARVEGLPFALNLLATAGPGETLELWLAEMNAWLTQRTVHLGPIPEISDAIRHMVRRSMGAHPTWLLAAFAQASVLRGTFSSEDIDRVIDLSAWPEAPSTLGALGVLLDNCLIARAPARDLEPERPLFRMPAQQLGVGTEMLGVARTILLPDGASWSGSASRAAAERRHVAHFTALGAPEALRALDGEEGAEQLRRLATAQENLVAATRRARRHGDQAAAAAGLRALAALASRLGPSSLMNGALEDARSLTQLPELAVAELHADLATARVVLGESASALEHIGEAIALVPRDGPPLLRGRLAALTLRLATSRDLRELRAKQDRALGLMRRSGDSAWIARMLLERTETALEDDEIVSAELDEAVELARSIGNVALEVEGLQLRARVARAEGRQDDAWAALKVAGRQARLLGPCRLRWRGEVALSELASALGHAAEADEALLQALPALVAMGDPVGTARIREIAPGFGMPQRPMTEDDAVRSIAPWIS